MFAFLSDLQKIPIPQDFGGCFLPLFDPTVKIFQTGRQSGARHAGKGPWPSLLY